MCNTALYNIRSQCKIGFAGRRSNDFGIVILLFITDNSCIAEVIVLYCGVWQAHLELKKTTRCCDHR